MMWRRRQRLEWPVYTASDAGRAGGRLASFSLSPQKGPAADSFIPDVWPPRPRENEVLLF